MGSGDSLNEMLDARNKRDLRLVKYPSAAMIAMSSTIRPAVISESLSISATKTTDYSYRKKRQSEVEEFGGSSGSPMDKMKKFLDKMMDSFDKMIEKIQRMVRSPAETDGTVPTKAK